MGEEEIIKKNENSKINMTTNTTEEWNVFGFWTLSTN